MPTIVDRGDVKTKHRIDAKAEGPHGGRRGPIPAAFASFISTVRRIAGVEARQTFDVVNGSEEVEGLWRLTARVEEDDLDGGFIAECPGLPGCMAQGETREEALANLSAAAGDIISARLSAHLEAHEFTELPTDDPSVRCYAIPVA